MAIFQDNHDLLVRLRWVQRAFVVLAVVILAKLWYLAVIQYHQYQKLAERNHVRTIPLLAPRGLIFDREGRVLVDNASSFNLLMFRDEVGDLEQTLDFLVQGLDLNRDSLRQRLESTRSYALYQPVVVKENLGMDEIAYVMAHHAESPGLRIFRQPRRYYPYGSLAAHVLGYVGEVSSRQLETPEFSRNRPGDIIGKFGLERTYNRHLMGKDGSRRVLVNSIGKTLQELQRIEPIKGQDLTLTLDLDLQMVAEHELGEGPGAVVALNPKTGEILASSSHPAFDPNLFAVRISRSDWEDLINNPDNPFQNRTIQSAFSPGSIFKVVMALAGLETGLVTPETSVYCNGAVELYGHRFRCWREGGHGRVALREAIQQSCNVYFYLLGQKLGIDRISAFSQQVGLGVPTGIDLVGEVAGLVPSDPWKRRALGEPWYAGETISVAIGQGPMNVTPLQLARAMGVIATGQAPPLRLTDEPRPEHLEPVPVLPPPHFSSENLQAVREGMWSAVNDWGTGRGAQVAHFDVCGKTGTAQTISQAARAKLSKEEQARFEPNAWFVGFAPRDDPEIVVAVIVQRGGSGGGSAAPIAGKILQAYYRKYKLRQGERMEVAHSQPEVPSPGGGARQ